MVATWIIEMQYRNDGIIVQLEWIQEDGIMYTVAVMPQAPIVFNGSASVQILLHYNTLYNVSTTAVDTVCGRNNTNVSELHYGMSAN